MAGRFVIDTNMAVALMAREPEAVRHWDDADEGILPVTVLGELLYGARHSGRPDANERRVWEFTARTTIVACSLETADRYASIKAALRRRGRPIPDNDVWIAAACLVAGATLASRDAHFDSIPGLTRDEWR